MLEQFQIDALIGIGFGMVCLIILFFIHRKKHENKLNSQENMEVKKNA